MAFNEKELIRIANAPKASGQTGSVGIYVLATADAPSTIEANGYFDGALSNGLEKGDVILTIASFNGTPKFHAYLVTVGGADVTVSDELAAHA